MQKEEMDDERREDDPPGSSFRTLRATTRADDAAGAALFHAAAIGRLDVAEVPRYGQLRAALWPDPKQMKFTIDRSESDPHNMQNRHAPLNRRRTDRPD